MTETHIVLNNARITIRDNIIFNAASITINSHDLIRIKGVNGSGKTVLINTMLGFLKVSADAVQISYDRQSIVYIQDAPFFFDSDTIHSVLSLYCKLYRVSKDEIIKSMDVLDFSVVWGDKRIISELSKGMKKKLLILPLFFENNSFFVLDEIFTGLDKNTCKIVMDQLIHLVECKATIVMVEHNDSIMKELYQNNHGKIQWEDYTCEEKSLVLT